MFSQFMGAEMIVKKHGLTKADLDAFALESHRRAIAATEGGKFEREIVPVAIETPEGSAIHKVDEGIRFDATLESIAGVKLLQEGGTITAATSSRSEEHTSELQSLMRISYAVFCLKKKKTNRYLQNNNVSKQTTTKNNPDKH